MTRCSMRSQSGLPLVSDTAAIAPTVSSAPTWATETGMTKTWPRRAAIKSRPPRIARAGGQRDSPGSPGSPSVMRRSPYPRDSAGGLVGRPPPLPAARPMSACLLGRVGLHLLLELLLQGFEVEARTFLHRGKLKDRLRGFRDLLLHESEPPELVCIPVVKGEGTGEPRALERIQPQVDQDRPVRLHRRAKPSVRLVDEPVLVVADTHRAEGGLGEVEDLVSLRRSLPGDQIRLVVAVEM